MKSIVCLTILAVAFACVLACNPNENNKPQCTTSNLNEPIRNFEDPTRYWQCKSADAEAESIPCPMSEGFLTAKKDCVPFSEWKWVQPCSENDSN